MILVSRENVGNLVVEIFMEEGYMVKDKLEEFYYQINLLASALSEENFPVEKWFYTLDELNDLSDYRII